jgi:hypothetical protein
MFVMVLANMELSLSSHFLTRPQLLTRSAPLPVGRDIPQTTSTPEYPCV